MAFAVPSSSSSANLSSVRLWLPSTSPAPLCHSNKHLSYFTGVAFPSSSNKPKLSCCRAAAAKQPSGSVKKRSPQTSNKIKKKKKSGGAGGGGYSRSLVLDEVEIVEDDRIDGDSDGEESSSSGSYKPLPLPKPPAGFILDAHGKVVMASSKRIATIVDPANDLPLECIIRRIFRSSRGEECMLLCPVDTPILILKSTNEGWSAVSDEEVETILPAAAYALAKIHMHLVTSGFCYTARGGFCYSEDDIFEFHSGNDLYPNAGQEVDGLPNEGVEITCFHLVKSKDGTHYMILTPSDPVLFVAVKDNKGLLQIADDELLEDPAIVNAIDEETEFNALVEEEAALLESLLGER
ncbi:Protein of unknown function DUF3727 [Dillenia turbinata]|uniref:Uncharacterized protein n=1 Tax=Dillenia turbinata TaxID=194707 RepID=A0AAN8UZ52_9MAGN